MHTSRAEAKAKKLKSSEPECGDEEFVKPKFCGDKREGTDWFYLDSESEMSVSENPRNLCYWLSKDGGSSHLEQDRLRSRRAQEYRSEDVWPSRSQREDARS